MAKGPPQTRHELAAQQARELLLLADGYDDAGHPELARRSRVVARETIWLADALTDERDARQAIQRRYHDAIRLLGERAYRKLLEAAGRRAA